MDWTWIHTIAVVALNGLVLYLWKPWIKAYSEEKGRLLARDESLENIMREVRSITETQKAIETRLSGELWRRQWVLNQKRDIYAELLRAASEYEIWLADYVDNVKHQASARTTDAGCRDIAGRFFKAYSTSPLFLSKQSLEILDSAIMPNVSYHSSLQQLQDNFGDEADAACGRLHEGIKELIASAQADLAA
jgi:hypothetical protein